MNRPRLDQGAERTLSVVREIDPKRCGVYDSQCLNAIHCGAARACCAGDPALVVIQSSWLVDTETVARSSFGGRPKGRK